MERAGGAWKEASARRCKMPAAAASRPERWAWARAAAREGRERLLGLDLAGEAWREWLCRLARARASAATVERGESSCPALASPFLRRNHGCKAETKTLTL